MGHKRPRPSFETPRKRAAPQDDGKDVGIKPGNDGEHQAFASS
jgi:hypothetical protein